MQHNRFLRRQAEETGRATRLHKLDELNLQGETIFKRFIRILRLKRILRLDLFIRQTVHRLNDHPYNSIVFCFVTVCRFTNRLLGICVEWQEVNMVALAIFFDFHLFLW